MSEIAEIGAHARVAARALAQTSPAVKDAALDAIADALVARTGEILRANAEDLQRAHDDGADAAVVDRLMLDPVRIANIADALRDLIALPDPIGEIMHEFSRPNGLQIQKVRVPLGVIGIIYEGRPNVTVDAAGICMKSGNACILRGSRTAISSNTALANIIEEAGTGAGLPPHSVQLIASTDRESAKELMRAREYVDALIPRGGADLIRTVVEESTVPVIETGVGNCHVYVDASADIDEALPIVVNAKVQRPSVCNSAETLLVHRDIAEKFLPRALDALKDNGVEIRGDERVQSLGGKAATEDDWRAEYLDLVMAVKVVDSLDAAVEHIERYGTHHTEAILTTDLGEAERFARTVDSACVMINASTRFADGAEFGFGAEIGISNQKLHARGPMALPELTSYKYIVRGKGQVRE